MRIHGKHYRTIWNEGPVVKVIDQRALPFTFTVETIRSAEQMVAAISEMHVRGAPLIGIAGAYGVFLAAQQAGLISDFPSPQSLADFHSKSQSLSNARPTAVNLRWAVEQQLQILNETVSWRDNALALLSQAQRLADEDVTMCRSIGEHGLEILRELSARKRGLPVNILTHCNAGWLATVDYGTATAAIYRAAEEGIALHVWVDETRPRLQGAKLTAFELQQEGIPATLIADNTAGHLLQRGMVDVCIVGSDRTTRTGDVANKIGTYTKALAARANNIPFYVALPSSTIDWNARDGLSDVVIEERDSAEVTVIAGEILDKPGTISELRICNANTAALNFAFDVTPSDLVTALITERGIAPATESGLIKLFPENASL